MDFYTKTKIIEDIKDEVHDLHPLLNHLLRNLPSVINVEYKHGPNEKGADFVVTKLDPALNRHTQIGVIAKIGKILSKFDDLERQIDECSMPRTILGGKSEVRLSEIWVINTSSITQNAQDKIKEKYRYQAINFITGEDLTKLIDDHADFYWHDIPSSVGSYLKELALKIESLDNELSVVKGLGCSNFYLEPDIQEFEHIRYVKQRRNFKTRLVKLVNVALENSVSVLEAEMGYGKSKFARQAVLHYCSPERFKQQPIIPIYSNFSELVSLSTPLSALLIEKTQKYFNHEEVDDCKFFFVIDGVDEGIEKNENWEEYLQSLIKEAKSNPNYRLLLTSRPLRKLDESVSLYSGTTRYILRPLSISKLVEFISKACENFSISKKIFEDLQKSDLFKQLPQSPIAAALLSRLMAQNTNDLPSNLTELYAKSIENLLGRWDIAKGVCTEKEFKDSEQAVLLIAEFLVNNGLRYMSYSEAKKIVSDWHGKRNTNTSLIAIQQRVFEKSGLFTIDVDAGTISFSHRSFGEYLCALKNVRQHKLIDANQSFDPYWIYVQFFQTGLLADCEEHLLKLLSYKPNSEQEAWIKVLLMPDYFLAGFQTEYKIIEDNLYKLFIEASELYLQITNGKTVTRLKELPEMHLLWFFQRIIRSSFGYEYFKKSIENNILRIDSELLDDKTKVYALFFAACAAAEFRSAEGFEYLVKNYGVSKLPLPISLAIQIEQDINKDFSKLPLLKEHEKKLNSILKLSSDGKKSESINVNNSIDDLFSKPVKTKILIEKKRT